MEDTPPKDGRGLLGADHRAKVIFALVALAGCIVVYFLQRGGGELPAWPADLAAAQQQAQSQNQRVLVLFCESQPGQITRRLAKTTLRKPENRQAIAEGHFLTVLVRLPSLSDETAKRYRISTLPTMLILSPTGREMNRREGMIGEVQFRGFLDQTKIVRPTLASN